MAAVYVDLCLYRELQRFLLHWPTNRFVGLYSNPRTIDRHTLMSDLIPTTFSGYGGEKPFPSVWTITDPGPEALGATDPLLWTHDGGPVGDYVAGYYVRDDDGTLLLAESRGPFAAPITLVGQVYRVDLKIATFTKFGGIT